MCHEWKPETDFAFRSKKTGKRQGHCRECQAKYRRQHYLNNRDAYIRREVERIDGYRRSNRPRILAYLSEHACVDCGKTDPIVLEFDHRDPQAKRTEVTVLAARKPWPIVAAEIAKCDVRCANCHRLRTAEQQHWSTGKGSAAPVELPTKAVANPDDAEVSADVRLCRVCHALKPMSEFSVKNKKTGNRAHICRSCAAAASKRHYERNKDNYLVRSRATKKKYRQRNRAMKAAILSELACVDCGEANPILLEFDHRDTGTKNVEVARLMSSGSLDVLLAEIAKCDVRCANCHRKRTAAQFKTYRFTVSAESRVSEAA